jgi:hypothetical protein
VTWPWPGPSPRKVHFYKHSSNSCDSNWTCEHSQGLFWVQLSWPLAPVSWSQIRPKSHIPAMIRPKSQKSNIGHDGTYSIDRKFHLIATAYSEWPKKSTPFFVATRNFFFICVLIVIDTKNFETRNPQDISKTNFN